MKHNVWPARTRRRSTGWWKSKLLNGNAKIASQLNIPVGEKTPAVKCRPDLEGKFLWLWKAHQGQELDRQHRFHPTRKWRFDFAHPATKVAIEVHGGIWSGGGHTRGSGLIRDMEKQNHAMLLGWAIFACTTSTITSEFVFMVKQAIEQRSQKPS